MIELSEPKGAVPDVGSQFRETMGRCEQESAFARNDTGNVGNRACEEVAGYLNVHLAGNRGKVSAERGGDRNRIIEHRDRGWVGVARQCHQNIFERHAALLFQTAI